MTDALGFGWIVEHKSGKSKNGWAKDIAELVGQIGRAVYRLQSTKLDPDGLYFNGLFSPTYEIRFSPATVEGSLQRFSISLQDPFIVLGAVKFGRISRTNWRKYLERERTVRRELIKAGVNPDDVRLARNEQTYKDLVTTAIEAADRKVEEWQAEQTARREQARAAGRKPPRKMPIPATIAGLRRRAAGIQRLADRMATAAQPLRIAEPRDLGPLFAAAAAAPPPKRKRKRAA